MAELRREGSIVAPDLLPTMKISYPEQALSHTGVRRAVTAAETQTKRRRKSLRTSDSAEAAGKEAGRPRPEKAAAPKVGAGTQAEAVNKPARAP